ncbi:MAG: hypothetical protein ACI9EF_002909 [Pseudohongiellaceae bacterium]|jgi:hypothetical protein
MSIRSIALAVFLAAFTSTPAIAGDSKQIFGQLEVGTLIGGENFYMDLRTTEPGAFTALFFGVSGTPTPLGPVKPTLGLEIALANFLVRTTDATGRDFFSVPTGAGAYGATCIGIPVFFQTVVQPSVSLAPWFATNVEAVEIEPICAPVSPFLVDDSAARLPAGYDSLGAVDAQTIDVNRDGYDDLVLGNDLELFIWVNDGTGSFVDETATRIAYDGLPIGGIFVVDLNKDNRDDIVVAGGYDDFSSTPDRVWYGDSFGTFTLDMSGSFPQDPGQTQSFYFRDFDLDGELDFLKTVAEEQHLGAPGGPDQVYFGQPNGTWLKDTAFENASWNVPTERSVNAAVGDIDNDGDFDIFICKADGLPNLLLDNDSFGNFSNVAGTQMMPLWSDNSQDAVFVDLDLDGDLDLVVANSHFSYPANMSGDVFINDGTGTFVEDAASEVEISTMADVIRLSVYAEDIDADGDPDVMMGVHDLFAGADQLLYLNQGGAQGGTLGELVRQTWFDPGDHITYAIVAFDADKDGDNDVLQVSSGVVLAAGPGLKTFFFENTRL